MESPARTATVIAAGMCLLLALLIAAVPAIAAGAPPVDASRCGPGGTAQTVADQSLDAEQLANAANIVQVVEGRGLPAYATTIALATAYQESKLHNVTQTVDHDSLGLFQQQVMYFTSAVAADPVKATNAFLDLLVQQPNWQTRPLTDVAADVQKPYEPYRGLYAQWQPLAAPLATQLWTANSATSPGLGQPAGGVPCPGNGADTGDPGAPASPTPGPGGLTLTGSTAGNAATTFALAQIGKPYVWGAQGPGSFDCSGLSMAAWASAGVTIPRVTYTQATTGTPVSVLDARTGDLALIPGSDGTAADPGHVGMVAGVDTTGKVWLVEAPRTGLTVRLTPISAWATQIVAIRRIG